jgi:hypothetical protein
VENEIAEIEAEIDDGLDEVEDLDAQWREAGFALARPIERKDAEPITRCEFFEPYAGMLKVMDKHRGDVTKTHALIARMTNLGMADVHRMHPYDFGRAAEVAGRFFGEFLPQDTAAD